MDRLRVSRLFGAAAAAAVLCSAPGAASATTSRYALSMLHFNVQYVAGGLVGFSPTPDPILDLSAEQVEDSIVREGFEPVLDLFTAHPSWGADIELQGYMLDVLAARHPAVLDKLRALAVSGQIEVVSFHYGDQLFLAYPAEDWRRSAALNRATFEKHGVPLSGTVFCQEGQSGIGMATAMKDNGYETLVWPKNLWSYQHGEAEPPAPVYRFGDVKMVTSRGTSWSDGQDDVETTWWFVDDGELLATGDFDPYLPEQFKTNDAALAETVAQLSDLEAQGYAVTTVGKYVAALEGKVPLADPPPLLDGTWQPSSTDGIRRWLGGFGLWWKDERDNDVRTLGAMAHRELLAAETIAAAAGLPVEEEIAAGFRLLAIGQVTDATGINPFRGEVEYGIAHFTEILRLARDVIERAKAELGKQRVGIDTASGAVDDSAAPPAGASIDAPFAIAVQAGDRPVEERWTSPAPGHLVVTIDFGLGDERALSVRFPGDAGDIAYTPGLLDEVVRMPRSAFVFDHFELALSNGLIGLTPDRFVIKDQAEVHVAAMVVPESGDVLFHDDTLPAQEPVRWVFHVTEGGEAQALEVARALNLTPKVWR